MLSFVTDVSPGRPIQPVILPARAREYVFTGVGLSVCLSVSLSVTTITKKIVDGFVPNFMGRFLGEREDVVSVSLRSVEGCGSNGQKMRKPTIVYILYFYYNSACGKCCQVLATKTTKFRFCRELYSLSVLSI